MGGGGWGAGLDILDAAHWTGSCMKGSEPEWTTISKLTSVYNYVYLNISIADWV